MKIKNLTDSNFTLRNISNHRVIEIQPKGEVEVPDHELAPGYESVQKLFESKIQFIFKEEKKAEKKEEVKQEEKPAEEKKEEPQEQPAKSSRKSTKKDQ